MDALKIWIAKFSVVLVWHFPNFPVLRNKEIFLKNFSQNSVKNVPCGVAGSERIYQRVWDSSRLPGSVGVKRSPLATNAPTNKIYPASYSADGQIYGSEYSFPVLAPKLITYQIRKGREKMD